MNKKLAKSDVNVQSMEQMVDRMKDGLYQAYQELDGKPETQNVILVVWEQVQQLGNANNDLMALLQGNRAALDEVKHQRDKALRELDLTQFDLNALQEYGLGKSKEQLAGAIAAACKLSKPDAERVIDALMNPKVTKEKSALTAFLQAFTFLADRLYTEEKFNQYSDED